MRVKYDVIISSNFVVCVCLTGVIIIRPTTAIEVVLNLTPLHILGDIAAKRTTHRMIWEGLFRHRYHPPESDQTWDIPRDDMPSCKI